MSRKFNKKTGNKGEEIAAQYLQEHGFEIIERNWEIEFGEIDIVASKDNTTYIVEVKTQFSNQQSSPEDELTVSKINKLKKLAEAYSMSHPKASQKLMLSAVCVLLEDAQYAKDIRFYENLLE